MSNIIQFMLTLWGIADLVVPRILVARLEITWPLGLLKQHPGLALWTNTLRSLISFREQPQSKFMKLPIEIRLLIYDMICWPDADNGSTPGAHHVLLLSKTIFHEARPYFANIPHTVILADGQELKSDAEIWGMPRRMNAGFHHSIQRLVVVLSICSIGKMSPDTFDVNIPKISKAQWYHLKKAVGIWPEVREKPLEEIRIVLRATSAPSDVETYRAELIRYIRNFKRTNVWADSGDCRGGRSSSVLLPLARAFNEARRNWVEDADFDNNLLIRFEGQRLHSRQVDAKLAITWMIQPSDDTSRTDDLEYPELTEVEERYIRSKMERKECSGEFELPCTSCLAWFSDRKVYLDHVAQTPIFV